MLKFSPANAKLQRIAGAKGKVYSLDLSAGIACPFAKLCRSRVVEQKGALTIKDGPHCRFRCFSASNEVIYPKTHNCRKHNFLAVKTTRGITALAGLIEHSTPDNASIVRYHVSGDFFKWEYFLAAVKVARQHPRIIYYAYTKAIPFVRRYLRTYGQFPSNFRLTLSYGGTHDRLIKGTGIKSCRVVYSENEAIRLGLPIDHDEQHAIYGTGDFCVLLHGIQPAGTREARALAKMRRNHVSNTYHRKG